MVTSLTCPNIGTFTMYRKLSHMKLPDLVSTFHISVDSLHIPRLVPVCSSLVDIHHVGINNVVLIEPK